MQSARPRARRPVKGTAGGPPLLYVDALNYNSRWFDGKICDNHPRQSSKSGDLWADMQHAQANVGVFVREAKAAGWKVTAFLDMVKDREDELETWWKRKRRTMQDGGTTLAPFVTIILGQLFEAEGATVRYAAATDNDPTLAAHADIDDAAVLSADSDFLRYYGTRASGERYFLKRLFSNFSVQDERNGGKLALWERIFSSQQQRDKRDWTLVTGVGEVKGAAEKFLPTKPYTTPIFQINPPGQRDSESRPLIRIGVSSATPFAFPACDPGAQATAERLALPLRLAVYQLLDEKRVVESFLEWKEYADGWRPEKVHRCWKFWGAAWDLELDHAASDEGAAVAVADDWEQEEEAERDRAEGSLTEEESALVRRLVGVVERFRQRVACNGRQ